MSSIFILVIALIGISVFLLGLGWLGIFKIEGLLNMRETGKKTDLVSSVSARRYRGQEEEKMPWRIKLTDWKTFHSVKIPVRFSVTWEDEGSPWSYWTVEGVEYNINIADNLSVGG